MFACLYAPPRGLAFRSADGVPRAKCVTNQLVRLAREYSPRIEIHGDNLVVLDTADLTGRPGSPGMFGDARELGATLRRSAADRGLYLRIAVASTRTAALLVVQKRSGLTVIEPGRETVILASLPLTVLKALAQAQGIVTGARRGTQVRGAALAIPAFALLSTVRRWGISTLGDLAHLPSAELFERLGVGGLTLQRFARGEDEGPLVPAPVEERFEASLVLEWPVEGLEPLSFVLSRVFDQLCARLERAGVGAAVIRVYLKLVTREIQTRTLQLPTPLRDPRVLRTLVLLDLESHPPSAGIDQVTVVVDPVPARTQQFSLLERARPSLKAVSTLIARLTALTGEGRCGSPALVDSHDMASFDMRSFDPSTKLGVDGESHRTVDNNAIRSAQDRRGKRKPRLGADSVRETPVDGDWRQVACVPSQAFADKFSRRRAPVASGNRTARRGSIPAVLDPAEREAWRSLRGMPRPRLSGSAPLCPMLRRFRVPIAARVRVQRGRPVRVLAPRVPGGEVVHWAGPWRTSGQWWTEASGAPAAAPSSGAAPWDRDAWDVSLADGGVYRIFHDRRVDRWFLEGLVD
jgi:nucleotidyltransferase/DNA polymerase involved in DNA repair